MIQMTEIDANEWVVVPILVATSLTLTVEIATTNLIDFGVVKDLQQWEDAEGDNFEREFWQEEFQGSNEIQLSLKSYKKGYSLIFWNSNYESKRVAVAYRLSYNSS
jgi:hypothetical protein